LRPVHVIDLDRHDTAYSAREALLAAPDGAQVWLIIPWRASWARNLVSLTLLRRAAEGHDIDLRIVSRDRETRTLAREAGLAAHYLLPLALRGYRVGRSSAVPDPERLDERLARRPKPLGVGTVLIAVALVCGLLAIVLGAGSLFVPTATVRIVPAAVRYAGNVDVIADPTVTEIDYEHMIVPARNVQVSIEGTGETEATGSIVVPDQPASGQVVFSNRSDTPVHIPKGTVVRTRSGKVVSFVTTSDVDLPGTMYATVRVGIVAQQPGVEGNVRELTITQVDGPLASEVDVLNDAATYGGTTRTEPVVAQEDLDRLPGITMASLATQAYERLIPELEEGEFIPQDAFEILVMEQYYGQAVGQRAEKVTMDMRVLVNGLAVDSRDLEAVGRHFLEAQAGEGLSVIESSLLLSRSPGNLVYAEDQQHRRFATTLSAEALLAPTLHEAQLRETLAGKRVSAARAWLNEHLELAAPPEISVAPSGWPFLPRLTGRITIEIDAETG